ncbi:nucleoside recognition domain-containing protein [Botrimarina sp.]|uniref:nucleoside recognition domain-containing protein n=1 Tax=Botrimarina sp. TaxID=2795802 RepID=UPI0032EAF005
MLLDRVWFWLLTVGVLYGLGKAALSEPDPPPPAPPPAAVEQAEGAEPPEPVADRWAITQRGQELTDAAIDAAQLAVEICLQLIGVMALWLGMLEIAKQAGMVDALARLLEPVMRWLFPDVPTGHPAQGAMLMNISANMLGLDNAATPFGLQAMRELDKLNPHEGTATNAMATFLAINTSSVTLLPISIIALRAAAGSESPASPIGGMFLATCVSTGVAIFTIRTLQKWPRYAVAPADTPPDGTEEEAEGATP